MKKILIAGLALAACSGAFASDSLIAGFNFGQFIGSGYPSTDGTTGDPVGSIGANYQGTNQPASTTSGVYKANNSIAGAYNPGYATWYWDGSHNSGTFDFSNGIDVVVYEKGSLNSVNQLTVNGYNMTGADNNFAGLSFAATGQKWSIEFNTTGFDDTATANNFSFAAFGTGTATIEWYLNGSNTSFATSTIAAGTDYTAYSVDLPASFYGQSSVTLEGKLTSGIVTFDNVQINGAVSAVPEPSTYAAIAGVLGLGFAAWRRRRTAA